MLYRVVLTLEFGLNPKVLKYIFKKSFIAQCNSHSTAVHIRVFTLQYCRKVWLGLWNSSMPAEPESRDEQKIKDFMVQKYERKRWYIPPQQVPTNNTSQSTPEPKPLKQL